MKNEIKQYLTKSKEINLWLLSATTKDINGLIVELTNEYDHVQLMAMIKAIAAVNEQLYYQYDLYMSNNDSGPEELPETLSLEQFQFLFNCSKNMINNNITKGIITLAPAYNTNINNPKAKRVFTQKNIKEFLAANPERLKIFEERKKQIFDK